jgi:hypothetical protein
MSMIENRHDYPASDDAMTFAECFRLVNVAIGMLMKGRGLRPGAAYAMIAEASRRTGRTVAQVAADYIAAGRL